MNFTIVTWDIVVPVLYFIILIGSLVLTVIYNDKIAKITTFIVFTILYIGLFIVAFIMFQHQKLNNDQIKIYVNDYNNYT